MIYKEILKIIDNNEFNIESIEIVISKEDKEEVLKEIKTIHESTKDSEDLWLQLEENNIIKMRSRKTIIIFKVK